MQALEGIAALQPPSAELYGGAIDTLRQALFDCATPSQASVQHELRTTPTHACGLTFANAGGFVDEAAEKVADAQRLLDLAIERKLEILLSPAIRDRLQQGRSEPAIAAVLGCATVGELRAVLIPAALAQPDLVSTINRYLKRISVVRVRIAGFRPTLRTVERAQLSDVALEFQQYLEDKLQEAAGSDDTLPVLQLE